MRIRRATSHDAGALSALALDSKAHWNCTRSQRDAWQDDLTVTRASIATSPTHVAETDDGLVGFHQLITGTERWTLEHFRVAREAMGRGNGRTLLEDAVRVAAPGGARANAIDADRNAVAFHLACGARRVGSVAAPIDTDRARERPQFELTVE